VALQLKRRGVIRVRPLDGGIAQWIASSLPVSDLVVPATESSAPAVSGARGAS